MILDRSIPKALADEFTEQRQDVVLGQIMAGRQATRVPRIRQRRTALAAGAAFTTALLAGGAAYASGLVPPEVTHAFASMGFSAPKTALMAELTLPNGSKWQVWRGPNSEGGMCETSRQISPSGYVDPDLGGFCDGVDPYNAWAWKQFGFAMPGYSDYGPPDILVMVQNVPSTVSSLSLSLPSGTQVPLPINEATHFALGYIPAGNERQRVHVYAVSTNGKRFEVGEVSDIGDPAQHVIRVPNYTT